MAEIEDYKGSFAGSSKLRPSAVKTIFKAADKGNIRNLMLLASEVFSKDWDLKSYVQLRASAPALREWHLVGNDNNKEKTAELENMLRGLMPERETGLFSIYDVIKESGKAHFFGSTVFAVEKAGTNAVEEILGFKHYNPATFGFDVNKKCLTYKDENKKDHPVSSHHYYQCIPYINPHTEAICRIAIILFLLKNTPAWEWASYVERFAEPLIHGKVDAADKDTYTKEATAMYELMKKFAGKKFAVTPNESSINLVETSGKGAEIYERLLKYFRDRVATLILGTTSGLEGSARRVAELIREDLIEGDCRAIAKAITTTIIKPWWYDNVGSNIPFPHFAFKPRKNTKQLIDNVSKLAAAGFEVDPDQLSELTGLTITKAPNPQGGM